MFTENPILCGKDRFVFTKTIVCQDFVDTVGYTSCLNYNHEKPVVLYCFDVSYENSYQLCVYINKYYINKNNTAIEFLYDSDRDIFNSNNCMIDMLKSSECIPLEITTGFFIRSTYTCIYLLVYENMTAYDAFFKLKTMYLVHNSWKLKKLMKYYV